jgi:hypothetical protein
MRGCWSFSWSGKCAIHAPLKGALDKLCTNVTGLERIQISFARQIPSQSVFSAAAAPSEVRRAAALSGSGWHVSQSRNLLTALARSILCHVDSRAAPTGAELAEQLHNTNLVFVHASLYSAQRRSCSGHRDAVRGSCLAPHDLYYGALPFTIDLALPQHTSIRLGFNPQEKLPPNKRTFIRAAFVQIGFCSPSPGRALENQSKFQYRAAVACRSFDQWRGARAESLGLNGPAQAAPSPSCCFSSQSESETIKNNRQLRVEAENGKHKDLCTA